MPQETFVTRYVLDDTGYSTGGQRVIQTTKNIASAQAKAGIGTSNAAQAVKHAIKPPPVQDWAQAANYWSKFTDPQGVANYNKAILGLNKQMAAADAAAAEMGASIAGGVTAIGTAAVAAVAFCISAAREARMLERSFEGVLGSAKRVQQMMGFLRQESDKTGLSKQDLGDSARQLMLQNMDANKWLPIIEKLAAGSGRMDSGGLSWATDLLTQARAGEFNRVMSSERMGQAGITKGDLQAHGAKFDLNAEFVGTAEEFLEVFKKTIDDKLTGVLSGMTADVENNLASIWDNIKDGASEIGKLFMNVINPVVRVLNSGAKSVGAFARGFVAVFGDGMSSGALEYGINETSRIFNEFIDHMVMGVYTLIAVGSQLKDIILDSFTGSKHLAQNILEIQKKGTGMYAKYLTNKYGNADAPSIEGGPKDPTKSGTWLTDFVMGSIAQKETARNTERIAQHTEALVNFSQNKLGGGDLGRLGLTSEQLQGIKSHKVTVKVEGSFAPIINEALRQLQAQGFKLVKA